MITRALKAGEKVRCNKNSHSTGGFSAGQIYTLRKDADASDNVDAVLMFELDDRSSTYNAWNRQFFDEIQTDAQLVVQDFIRKQVLAAVQNDDLKLASDFLAIMTKVRG